MGDFNKTLKALEIIESIEDKSMLRLLIARAAAQHDRMTDKKRGGFYPNDKVTFMDRCGRKYKGVVVRENRRSVTVRVRNCEHYVSPSILTLVKKAA